MGKYCPIRTINPKNCPDGTYSDVAGKIRLNFSIARNLPIFGAKDRVSCENCGLFKVQYFFILAKIDAFLVATISVIACSTITTTLKVGLNIAISLNRFFA